MFATKTLGACAAIALALFSTAAARAEPAMWVVRDADSTIYLFGTVHMLRPELNWRTPKIEAALKEAGELWLEIPNVEADQASPEMAQAMMQLGLSPNQPLSSRLTAEEFAKLNDLAKTAGLDPTMVNMFKPWLAAMVLSTAPMQKAGYDPATGVEAVLSKQAKAEGDRLNGFETLRQQLGMFASLSDEAQLEFLRQTIEMGDTVVAEMDGLAAMWLSADLAGLETGAVTEMRETAPHLYEVLLTRRNEDWAVQIERHLKGSGVTFIAVGAAHLLGPDSLQSRLKARGIESARH